MNSIDILIVFVVLVCMGVGWSQGSVWLSSGLAAGFVGFWAADIYGPVVAASSPHWPGIQTLATVLVFAAVAVLVIGAGSIIRKVLSAAFLSFLDKLSGFAIGLVVGLVICAVGFKVMLVVRPAWSAAAPVRNSFVLNQIRDHWGLRPPLNKSPLGNFDLRKFHL